MYLRAYKKEDSAIICKWLRTAEELYKWSADRYNKFPLSENDIDDNYVAQIKTGRFIPLTAVDENSNVVGHFILRAISNRNNDLKSAVFDGGAALCAAKRFVYTPSAKATMWLWRLLRSLQSTTCCALQ